jgi:hypothetical protein
MLNYLTTYYNLNQEIHPILLKSQYYNSSSLTCFGSHWPIIREHTVAQNSTMEHRIQAAPITVSSAQLDLVHKYYMVKSFGSCMQKPLSFCFVQLCAPW